MASGHGNHGKPLDATEPPGGDYLAYLKKLEAQGAVRPLPDPSQPASDPGSRPRAGAQRAAPADGNLEDNAGDVRVPLPSGFMLWVLAMAVIAFFVSPVTFAVGVIWSETLIWLVAPSMMLFVMSGLWLTIQILRNDAAKRRARDARLR